MTSVPPGLYRVFYSSGGGFTDFSAADDKAAWAHAERHAYGARIIELSRVRTGIIDEMQRLTQESRGADYPDLASRAQKLRAALAREREDGAVADMPEDLFAALSDLAAELKPWTEEE